MRHRNHLAVCLHLEVIIHAIPCKVEEELYRIFHRFEVADIENPKLVDAIIVCQGELFPHILHWSDIQEFAVAWCSDVIHVVIESPSALTLALFHGRHTANVAPVVVTKEDSDVIRHSHAVVIIVLHLFI